jgi:hypothetical protein
MIAQPRRRSITQPLARRPHASTHAFVTPSFPKTCKASVRLSRSARGTPQSSAPKALRMNCQFAKSFKSHSYEKSACKSFRSHSYKSLDLKSPEITLLQGTPGEGTSESYHSPHRSSAPPFPARYFITSLRLPAFCRYFLHPYIVSLRNHDHTKAKLISL